MILNILYTCKQIQIKPGQYTKTTINKKATESEERVREREERERKRERRRQRHRKR